MGGGRMAVAGPEARQRTEVPRLTAMLRVRRGATLDPEKEYLLRHSLLDGRRRVSPTLAASGVGSSALARKIFPSWDGAPRDAQTAFRSFLLATTELLDGELAPEELGQSALTVYDVLGRQAEAQEHAAEKGHVPSRASFLHMNYVAMLIRRESAWCRQQLAAIFGRVSSDSALTRCFQLAIQLRQWEDSLKHAANGRAEYNGQQGVATNGPHKTPGRADDGLVQPEFGIDLEFHSPDSDTGSWDLWDTAHIDEAWDRGAPAATPPKANGGPSHLAVEQAEGAFTPHDLRWLRSACEHASLGGAAAHMSADELAMAIARVLESDRFGDEIAGDLFDLIGDSGFELIEELLKHRKALVDSIRSSLAVIREEKHSGALSSQARIPTYGTQVSVQTESAKLLEKLRRKEEKRQAHHRSAAGQDSELDRLAGAGGGFESLLEAEENKQMRPVENLYGKGDDSLGFKALPTGTTRKAFKGYEEVHVPPTPTAPLGANEHLVKIGELEDFAQKAFEGYKTLNRIQSRIYRTAFYSNENLLVCAPTGAGKTNIAMITVLHEIRQHLQQGIVQKSEFKIVYVAPMKALAAEMAAAFSRRLSMLGLTVKELTGDMQLSKRELEETQVMIITTPEKWDVITRKSSDVALASLVRLLIVDEVHLLNDDRGPVIETLVARTLRQVESSQSMIRIVGLSATLPNYKEVAQFLRVNLDTGLFFFDGSYRPVPLAQQYIGVSEQNFVLRNSLMNEICFNKVMEAVKKDQQAMVFVHSRKDTVKTARILVEFAQRTGVLGQFTVEEHSQYGLMKKEVSKSRNRELAELFQSGFGCHHAGMLRSDRALTERLFSEGLLKVLVCTATLAWGVNLPAHMVIIKGTQIYDSKAGGWKELGMLDVMQIFGRAGRPQFDTSGEGIIITSHSKLSHYLRLLTHQLPIESQATVNEPDWESIVVSNQFIASMKDNLNAEIVLGTVTSVKEASTWLSYTYLFKRMQSNPLAYGMTWEEMLVDPQLTSKSRSLITEAARALDKAKMVRFDEKSGNLYVTELGRVASHFYIQYTSVETYNEMLKRHMSDSELLHMVAHSSEFENIAVREEEQPELETARRKFCPVEVKASTEEKHGKIDILIQVYISRGFLDGFSLIADSAYISASLGRIMRALFEICLRRGWSSMAAMLLEYCKSVDRRVWPHQHPLRQFDSMLSLEVLHKLEERGAEMDRLYDMDEKEIGALIRHPYGGKLVSQCLQYFPKIFLSANISPITRTVLQVTLSITPDFVWKDKIHGTTERWLVWVEDSENEHIYHSDVFNLNRKMVSEGRDLKMTFTIPIFEPLPSQYYVRAISDNWLQAQAVHTMSFQHLILPEKHPPHTELLDLKPLPVTALHNPLFESLYRFSHFNPIQTQAFHTLYNTDHNVLLGAPTGSGKTISAELAMLRLFSTQPGMKVIYIAPLKALVRERMTDWKRGLVSKLNLQMVELTGDFTPDLKALISADIIISTPEKWDGISRNWSNRTYARKVGLMVIDEIHLLGADRGPILEVIVSRMRYIAAQTAQPIRFVGLSTALANAKDLGDWLGIDKVGLYNFKPSVRPVPLEVHIQGYPGKFYCPRMNSMNKPAYAAINTHSPLKPVLIFVSSRRQTRLTALDLIQCAAADERPRQFLSLTEEEIAMVVAQATDATLKHTLQFGVGLHHAGLNTKDRSLVEELFTNCKIQVLVCTSTLAWGVNLPAHLVIIKGTEFFDGKLKRYVDFPITDVLQMMGRAGRPQFDQHGKAVILVHEPKKSFYKKASWNDLLMVFLYEPFPVESSLAGQLHDHLNAEVVAGTIANTQDALDYLTWTYFFRRLVMNPSYYDLDETTSESINLYLSSLIGGSLQDLEDAGCVRVNEDHTVDALYLGRVASLYYLHYTTLALFSSSMHADNTPQQLLQILSGASEFDELPVRHNEDILNGQLASRVRWPVHTKSLEDPHAKANLLFQAHFSQLSLPISDYITDTKSLLDQSIRILQAMVDVAANGGWLQTTLRCMQLMQMVLQGLWMDANPCDILPHFTESIGGTLRQEGFLTLKDVVEASSDRIRSLLRAQLPLSQLNELMAALGMLPRVTLTWRTLEEPGKRSEDGESMLEVHLSRRRQLVQDHGTRAYAPRFPKMKEPGWWLLVGTPATKELHVLKRVTFSNHITTRLLLPAGMHSKGKASMKVDDLRLYFVSDCYLGLDQEHSITVP
eukprot:SM000013S26539  [mRNA]  locus=s13:882491:898189:- [translate_table: standard]